jgi:lipopolysaccharide/colanic/teichoic acid biosynthesis glycosyltransferase
MRVPLPTSRNSSRIYVSVWDLTWALLSPIVALWLRNPELVYRTDLRQIWFYWGLSAGFAILAFLALRVQDGMTRYFSVYEALDIAEAVLFAELMTCVVLFTLTGFENIPRSMPFVHGLLLAGGLLAARIFTRIVFSAEHYGQEYKTRAERIILIGANRFGAAFVQLLRAYAPQREPVTAILDLDPRMIGRAVSGVQVIGTPQDLDSVISEFAIHGVGTDRVVIAGEADFLSPAVLQEVQRICEVRKIDLRFLPRLIGVTESKAQAPAVAAAPALAEPSIPVASYFQWKRFIDVVGALTCIVLLLPLLVVGGVLVLFDVGSPILFWQERVGWKKRSFLIYKFRTLRAPFDSDGQPNLGGREPSRIGQFLRRSRLDELPQLLNVLLGDMSLAGPRPLLPEDQPANMVNRLSIRPGITGWAQVNGAKLVTKEEKERLDDWYVSNASLWIDVRIAMLTIAMLMRNKGSSAETLADAEQVRRKNIRVSAPLTNTQVPAE